MTFDGVQADGLTPLIRRLNQSLLSLAAIGGALKLQGAGLEAHPAVADEMAAALIAMGAPTVTNLSPDETAQGLGLIRTFFIEARDLLEAPDRAPGWTYEDPAILQGIGSSSAGMVERMTRLADERPWLAELLARKGAVLDIGTGVGGVALAAAGAWPAKTVLGIDLWAPSLVLAEQNRTGHSCAGRVAFRNQALQDFADTDAFDLIWLPTPFISGDVVMQALPSLLRALRPGGGIIAGVLPSPPDPLGHALARLRTIRNGGHPWSCDGMAELLTRHDFDSVEVPANQAGMYFVLGRRAR